MKRKYLASAYNRINSLFAINNSQHFLIFSFFIFSILFLTLSCSGPSEPNNLDHLLNGSVQDQNGVPVEGVGVHYSFEFESGALFKSTTPPPSTKITFKIPSKSKVTIKLYRYYTREYIDTIVNDTLVAGDYSVTNRFTNLTNGFYILKMEIGSEVTEKIMFIKLLDKKELESSNPLTITNSNGFFSLPYGIFGFDVEIYRNYGGNPDQTTKDKIINKITIILAKPGYRTLTQELKIDVNKSINENFSIQKL